MDKAELIRRLPIFLKTQDNELLLAACHNITESDIEPKIDIKEALSNPCKILEQYNLTPLEEQTQPLISKEGSEVLRMLLPYMKKEEVIDKLSIILVSKQPS